MEFLTPTTFLAVFIVGIFVFDFVRRWWRENEWKRRWRKGPEDDT
jgi:hypothetical protein